MREIKKTSSELYSILSDILDCDYRRLIDAFDDVDGDVLTDAISEAREHDCQLTIGRIMAEAIDNVISELFDDFELEKENQMTKVSEESEVYEFLENFDPDDLRDSIQFNDVLYWSEISSSYSKEDMKKYVTYLSNTFEKLINLLGEIDGFPEPEKEEVEAGDNEEICPHCDYVNSFNWDCVSRKMVCKGCGEEILLCSVCDMYKHSCGKCPYEKKVEFAVGMEVTVSIKTLYTAGITPGYVSIETEEGDDGIIGYYDFHDKRTGHVVCMDGETCTITKVDNNSITLLNKDGEVETEFMLSLEEANICCFACPE